MTLAPEPGGLRGPVSAACRSYLRGDTGSAGHAAECASCTARDAFRARIAAHLRRRPPLPEVSAATLLSGVHERVVEAAEGGSLGQQVAAAMPVAGSSAAAWPDPLLRSDMAVRTLVAPQAPSPSAWALVQASIRSSIATGSVRTRRRWWVGLTGVAAAAIVAGVLSSDQRPSDPQIVFADLERMPAVEFAVVRYGALRPQ